LDACRKSSLQITGVTVSGNYGTPYAPAKKQGTLIEDSWPEDFWGGGLIGTAEQTRQIKDGNQGTPLPIFGRSMNHLASILLIATLILTIYFSNLYFGGFLK